MNEELKEKLKSILADHGIDEGTTEQVLVELEEGKAEPKPEEQDQPIIQEENGTEEAIQDEPQPEEGEIPPVEETLPPVPPVEEVPPEVPPVEEPPVEQPPLPDYDAKIEELKKTNEALLARVDSLEEALRKAGVIEGETEDEGEFGFHKDNAPAKEPIDDGLDDFFSRANKHSY